MWSCFILGIPAPGINTFPGIVARKAMNPKIVDWKVEANMLTGPNTLRELEGRNSTVTE